MKLVIHVNKFVLQVTEFGIQEEWLLLRYFELLKY